MNTRLLSRSLILALLVGGCATPLLDIQEPTEQQLVAAKESLDNTTLPDSPFPETLTPLKEGLKTAVGRVVFAAQQVCQRLKPRIDAVRCDAMFMVPTLYNNKQVNAFADQNDNIGVFTGLLFNMREESELAAVIAHEYAHVMLGHVEKKMTNALTGMLLAGGLMAATSRGQSNPDAMSGAMQLGMLAGSRAYSPEMEIEADRLAIYILKEARYPVTAMHDSIVRLHRIKPPKSSGWFSTSKIGFLETHPSNDRRIAHILSAIKDVKAGVPVTTKEAVGDDVEPGLE